MSYQWSINKSNLNALEFTYTPQENGKELLVEVDGTPYTVTLDASKAQALNLSSKAVWGQRYFCGPGSGLFDAPATIHTDPEKAPVRKGQWKEVNEEKAMFPSNILESYFLMQQ